MGIATMQRVWQIGATCKIVVHDKNATAAFLGQADEYTRQLSGFDRMARCRVDEDPGDDVFRSFVAGQACDYEAEDLARFDAIIAAITPKLQSFAAVLPQEIWLMMTTGREEGGTAAYTRGQAIVFPTFIRQVSDRLLKHVFVHEVFHVLSRHDEARRRQLYRLIHFEPCAELEFPAALAAQRISNPDGYKNDSAIRLLFKTREKSFVPISYSRTPYCRWPQCGEICISRLARSAVQ